MMGVVVEGDYGLPGDIGKGCGLIGMIIYKHPRRPTEPNTFVTFVPHHCPRGLRNCHLRTGFPARLFFGAPGVPIPAPSPTPTAVALNKQLAFAARNSCRSFCSCANRSIGLCWAASPSPNFHALLMGPSPIRIPMHNTSALAMLMRI